MGHLHIYTGGTIGGTDGTEVTNLSIKNVLSQYLESKSSSGGAKPDENYLTNLNRTPVIIPLYLRMDNGYMATDVQIETITNSVYSVGVYYNNNYHKLTAYTSYPSSYDSNLTPSFTTPSSSFENIGFYSTSYSTILPSNTNALLLVEVIVRGDATGIPDNSQLFNISYTEEAVV